MHLKASVTWKKTSNTATVIAYEQNNCINSKKQKKSKKSIASTASLFNRHSLHKLSYELIKNDN